MKSPIWLDNHVLVQPLYLPFMKIKIEVMQKLNYNTKKNRPAKGIDSGILKMGGRLSIAQKLLIKQGA
jgi:hypothetical protein